MVVAVKHRSPGQSWPGGSRDIGDSAPVVCVPEGVMAGGWRTFQPGAGLVSGEPITGGSPYSSHGGGWATAPNG